MSKYTLTAIGGIIIVLGVTGYMSHNLSIKPKYDFVAVKSADVTQGVSENGTVQAAQDLDLAFQKSGNVTQVNVKVGDKVSQGRVLAALDSKDASAAINQASAALAAARANYNKVINGATGPDVDVAQTALDNAKKNLDAVTQQQTQGVNNAFLSLMNSTIAAVPATGNIGTAAIIVSGTYNSSQQGVYTITSDTTGGTGQFFHASGLESSSGQVKNVPVALGSRGLFIQFSGTPSSNDTWTITIPNTSAANYVANLNAYNAALQTQTSALQTAQATVDSAQAALDLKITAARPEDVAAAKAQVDSASAMLEVAQNTYSNGVITAPIDGVITSVDIKLGESASPGKEAIKIISGDKLQVETFISESDISKIKVGDNAVITLDAYGSGTTFAATVLSTDPAATVQNGISSYKTTLQFTNSDDRVKEGLGANVAITDQTKQNVLVVPQSAIIKNNNQDFVLVDAGNGKITQTQVQTGITDLDGNVEITSGLSQGQMVAYFGK